MSRREVDLGAPHSTTASESREDMSLGQLVGRMSADLSTLFHQEVELAKVEIKEEVTKASRGGAMFGGTAVTAYMALVLLSFAAAWGLATAIPRGFAFLAIGVLYAIAAAVLFAAGRRKLNSVHGPDRTMQTVKEDAQWARERMN